MQAQSFGRSAWFNATLDGRLAVQSSKWLIPIDLQQWPKSLPIKGSLELDVLQLPLGKLPWIAKDGSIAVGGKGAAPIAAATPAASRVQAVDSVQQQRVDAHAGEDSNGALGVTAGEQLKEPQQSAADGSDGAAGKAGGGDVGEAVQGVASLALPSELSPA